MLYFGSMGTKYLARGDVGGEFGGCPLFIENGGRGGRGRNWVMEFSSTRTRGMFGVLEGWAGRESPGKFCTPANQPKITDVFVDACV